MPIHRLELFYGGMVIAEVEAVTQAEAKDLALAQITQTDIMNAVRFTGHSGSVVKHFTHVFKGVKNDDALDERTARENG